MNISQKAKFDSNQKHTIGSLSSQASLIIENSELYCNTMQQFDGFKKIDQAIMEGEDFRKILELIFGAQSKSITAKIQKPPTKSLLQKLL